MNPELPDQTPIGPDHQIADQRPIGPDHQLSAPPPLPSRRRKITAIVISILILLLFVLVFVWVLHRHEEAAPKAGGSRGGGGGPVTITAATAQTGDIGLYIAAIGNVTPVYTDSITSQVGGSVMDVHFTEGQLVQKGAPLIDIDDRPYVATLLQAQGALQRDVNLLAQAKMDLDRYRKAWARDAISKQTLDDQEKLVLQDEGIVKSDQGAVQYDQVQVDYCHISSPIAGRVGLRLIDPGNVVQDSGTQTLVVITQISPITVIFTIPEDSIDLIEAHINDPSKLLVDALDRTGQKKIASGFLLTLDNQIDTTTGTVKARALFPNEDARLFPNQFVNARLLVTTYHDVTLIPSSAIQHNGQESFVYTIEDGAAHMQDVTPGISEAGFTQVQGISPGDVVANSGFEKLQDKSKVAIAKEPATRASAQPGVPESEEPTTGPSTQPTTRRSRRRHAQ